MQFCSLKSALAAASAIFALAISTPAPAGSFTITVNDNGACAGTWQTTGTPTNPTITCVTGSPPPAGSPVCTITPSQSVSPNTSVNLALTNCTVNGGAANFSYSWNVGSVNGTQVGTGSSYTTPALSQQTTYFATVTDTGTGKATTYSTTVSMLGSPPPVGGAGNCGNYSTIFLGDLTLDGVVQDTRGMRGATVAYGRITIPDAVGKKIKVSVFEHGYPSYWRKAYLSKTACDFTPGRYAWGQGTGVDLFMSIGVSAPYMLTVQPGEVWYVNVKDESLYGTTSTCPAGQACEFGYYASPPN